MTSRREFIVHGARIATASAVPPLLPRFGISLRASAFGHSGPDELHQLERLIPDLMTQAVVPGISIAIIKDAHVIWHRGFGVQDAASKTPVDEHTIFEAASVSKTVFAYAVLQLCDRGTLSLDHPLTQYTSERVIDGDPRLDRITARQILSHTSGFQNFRSRAEPLAIHFTPGARFEYSGEGYWYLQWVADRSPRAARICGIQIDASDSP